MPPQDPRELGSLEECRNRRLIAGLAGVVGEVVGTQGGLVRAVDQLERRGRHSPPRRRFRPRASFANVLVFGLVFGVLFTLGTGALPEGPTPAAEADTSRPLRQAPSTMAVWPVASRPQAQRGLVRQPTTTLPATAAAVAQETTGAATSAPTTTLPAETTTTSLAGLLPPFSVPRSTVPCKGKDCQDGASQP